VLSRARQPCLAGLKLVSDRQPAKILVDNHTDGAPAIWLHDDPADTAWIIVDVSPLDWSKLAYQFGHELGPVLCNSCSPNQLEPLRTHPTLLIFFMLSANYNQMWFLQWIR
jgi:hypothetical protein